MSSLVTRDCPAQARPQPDVFSRQKCRIHGDPPLVILLLVVCFLLWICQSFSHVVYCGNAIWTEGDVTVSDKRLPPEFEKLTQTHEPFLRRLVLVGIMSKHLRIPPVIVGGNAVEFYTLGGYATNDVDLVHPRSQSVGDLLESWGFEKEGRHWVHRELDLYVEVPADSLEDADASRVTRADIEGLSVIIIGLEDLIIDRLNAAVHWRSADDEYWASELVRTNLDRLDWDYLRRRCEEEKTFLTLEALENKVRHG